MPGANDAAALCLLEHDGVLYAGQLGAVIRLRDGSWETGAQLPDGDQWAAFALVADAQHLYVGANGRVWRAPWADLTAWQALTPPGLDGNPVYCLHLAADGLLYVGGSEGLWTWDSAL